MKKRRNVIQPVIAAAGSMSRWKYQQIAKKQRARLNEIAEKIERAEPLTKWESTSAASMLRHAAQTMIGGKGPRQRKLNPGVVSRQFWKLVNKQKMSKNKSYERLAEKFDCSEQAIKDIVREVSKQISCFEEFSRTIVPKGRSQGGKQAN